MAQLTLLQVIVNEETAHETEAFITKRLNAIKSQRSSGGEQEDLALVIGVSAISFIDARAKSSTSRRQESHLCAREGDLESVLGASHSLQSSHLLCVHPNLDG